MITIIEVIAFFWFVRTIKFVLFWIYLWQLKNYHIGRFVDHFRTYQGKKLFFNALFIIKPILLAGLFFSDIFLYLVLAVYIAEVLVFILQLARNRVLKPVFTFKAILLTLVCLFDALIFLLLFFHAPWTLLLYDILLLAIVSLIVLFLHIFFVMARNNVLQKAKTKMATFQNLTVIAITGSFGKTSTKEFLTTLLSSKFAVLATPEHKNSEIGIAQTILGQLGKTHQIFVVEMGAYNKGGIKLLCDMVKPKIGIVTGVNEQHLATFGSLQNLLSAEGGRELAQSLPEEGVLVVNGDNKHCLDLYKKFGGNKKIYTLRGNKIDSDIWTEHVQVGKNSLSFIVRSRENHMAHIFANVLGLQQAQNMLGAILVASQLGMSFEEIASAAKNIKEAHGGMSLKKGKYGIDIIDASYSSNPDGVMADLDHLATFKNKKVIIMPCLIELGAKSKEVHYQIGKKIAQVCDMAIITSREQFLQIKKGAMEDNMPADKIIFSDKPKEIFATVTTFCKEGDAILLEGRVPNQLIKLLHA